MALMPMWCVGNGLVLPVASKCVPRCGYRSRSDDLRHREQINHSGYPVPPLVPGMTHARASVPLMFDRAAVGAIGIFGLLFRDGL